MVAPAGSSQLSGQAAIDNAAALRAAEEARRRAEEAARRAAEEAKRRAEEARRLAEEARKKADEARKAAEAAEAKAAKSKDKIDQADAEKLRTQSDKDETDALKKEATASLRDKEKTLADSKLDDVRQRRPQNDPSEGTRAAQSEVDAAKKTVALYDAPAGAAPAAERPADPQTQALLDKAEKAAKPVFDAQARGEDPKAEDLAKLNGAVDEWQAAAAQDMREAAVQAQAQGEDPNKAIAAQAAKLRDAVEKGKEIDPSSIDKYLDQAKDAVKAESPAMRQLRSEQYTVQKDGEKQVADGRQAAKDADAAADKAEAYSKSFGKGAGSNDTIITAKQNAKDEATRLRKLSNEANDRQGGLVRTYGGTAPDPKDPNKTQSFVGSVNADYNAQVADLEVSEASKAYELAKAGNDPKKLAAAQDALDLAIDARDIMHAALDDAKAELERSDSAAELRDAKAAYEAEKEKQPQPYKVKHHGGFLQDDYETTELPEGYDWTFEVTPGSEMAKQVKEIDGKWYYVFDINGEESKTEMNPVTARLWEAQQKADAANAKADTAASTLQEVQNDLIGSQGQGPTIDPARFTGDADGINSRLNDANNTVATTQANLGKPTPPPGVQGVWAPSATAEQMGVALQNQTDAQKDADALKAMQDWRQAQYDQAAGKAVDPKHLADLKTKARNAQRGADEAKPALTAEEEADITDNKLPAARKALKDQEDEVTRLTAPDSKATQAERDTAQNKYDRLDLDVRDYETRLELEHAKQASLGAPYAYATASFAKPQLSAFNETRNNGNYGDTVTTDIYPDNYDPTWNIVPGKDGGVKADGLPRGISPEDVEVRYNPCGGGYTVTFKKNSEVLGRQSDMFTNYVVQKGTYKMNPATAELWNATNTDKSVGGGRLIAAQEARDQVLAERKQMAADAPPAKDAPPLVGPDGKPVPTLNFTDDLGPRKKAVDQKVVDANGKLADAQRALDGGTGDKTQLTQARDDAKAERDIALAEQKAVDAVMLWQEANRTRQLYEANERAGRPNASYAKPPREYADEMHAKAETARNDWYTTRNQHYKQVAARELDAAQKSHDDWKSTHPGLSDSGSDTAKALEAAKTKSSFADRMLAAGANQEAAAREYQYIAENLSPEQHDDPRALYKLFDKDPARMAQSIINSHFVQYGGDPTEMENRTQLANTVANALGWQPTTELDPDAPATNERLRRTQDLYGGLGKEQKEMRDKIVDQIIKDGGAHAKVTVLPVVYATEKGGVVKTAVFKVENKDDPRGKEMEFVDEQAWTYDSLDDYRANNSLPVEGVKLAMPSDGNFTLDDRGNVELYTGDARTETGWETFRRTSHIDWVVGGVGLVAGVVLTVGSFGTLSAPGVMLAAGSLTLLAAGYGAVTSAQSLYKQGSHGQDINPFTSTQARLDWLNLGLSVAAVPVVGASTRATMQAMRARNALQAALKEAGKEGGNAALAGKHFADFERYTQSAQAWGQPASAMARPFAKLPVGLLKKVGPLDAGSAYAFEEGARYLHDNWDQLAPGERSSQFAMLAMNASGFASPVFAKGYLRVHNAIKPQVHEATQAGFPTAGRTTNAPEAEPSNVVALDSRRGSGADAFDEAQAGGGNDAALLPFREAPATPVAAPEPVPDNVTPLHPDGPPLVTAEVSPDADLAPVIPLVLRRPSGDGPEPGAPGAAAGSARNAAREPQQQQLALAAGGEGDVANAPFTRSPHRIAVVRQLNPQASAQNPGGGGSHGQGQPPVPPAKSTPGPVPGAGAGSGAARPPVPAAQPPASTPASGAPASGPEALARLTQEPPAGSTERFTVSKLSPDDTIAGGAGVKAKRNNSYASFAEASAAAADMGGAWVHRVAPRDGPGALFRRGRAAPDEIMGAVEVNAAGKLQPNAVANPRASAWQPAAAARATPAAAPAPVAAKPPVVPTPAPAPVAAASHGTPQHQSGQSTGLAYNGPDIDLLLEGTPSFTDKRPAYAGPATMAELETSTALPTPADIEQTQYLASAGSPDGHAARDIPLRRRFVQWARGQAPNFIGAPDFVGGRYVLAKDANGLNQGAPDASFALLDRQHVYSSFETARAAAAAHAQASGDTQAGVVRLIGPKTAMAEVVASGSFRNDQVDGIVAVQPDGSVNPISIANRNAAHAPKPGEQFVDPHSAMSANDKVYSGRDKAKLFAKSTAYIVGTGAAFYATVRWGGGSMGWSMAGAGLGSYIGARSVFLRYAFDAFLYRGGVAGARQTAKIRLQKHLNPKDDNAFAQIANIADPEKQQAALFQLKTQLVSWHAARRGIQGRADYRQALQTLARDPADAAALATLERGAAERAARPLIGKRGWVNRVPPALRTQYAQALSRLEAGNATVDDRALLATAPEVGRGTQYAGALRGRVLRNVPGADRARYREAVDTLSTRQGDVNAALKTLEGIPLDTVQRHTTGARGAVRGIPKADRQSVAMAAETLRANPADQRSKDVLDGSPGTLTSPNSPLGRALFGARVLSFGLSHSAGTRLYLNPFFDGAAQQWTWNITSLDGARQWIGNEGSLHYAIGNATGLGATVAGRYATIGKARSGLDIKERGETPPAAGTTPDPTAVPLGKNGKPVPVYKATDKNSWFVRFLKGLGNPNAVKHAGVDADGKPMVKPSFVQRLPQYSSWGDSSGTIALTIADGMQGLIYAKAGQWDLAAPQILKVLSDVGIFRGTQKDYLDEYASNRKMGPRVYNTRWTNYVNAPLGEAKVTPTKISDGWIRRGWPPLVLLGVAVGGRVLAEEWSVHEKDKAVAAGITPGVRQTSGPASSSPTPTPSATPSQPQDPPTQQADPQQPDPQQPPRPEYWIVDGQVRERSSFSRMAEAKGERDRMGYDEALAQLFNLNPQYRRSLMDGYVDPVRLDDPDTLNNGTRIRVGSLP
ncbi:hypothetical protein C7T35_22375 [Variovorax sp. WS11]|uniref:DUF4781 domain-containing protein n=1 Tax=Variovorax sp. WS11 TaxID=1105204 RepID=UPI000D0D99B5|nr:DUF4781 domain-containing protein [Variovorax sp. WS11]NDZ16494.1 DUF4781 domain-containing protein [Variovorax sp. WS11]PSL82416.1 hypothetical protein C7T35_22375 [Variovorax sp. WS11]